MDRAFWTDKRVLVTGHTGFKGSWLSLWLQTLGANVIGYSLAPPTEANLFTLAEVAHGMESISGDIRHLDSLCRVFERCRPEIVFHMAAQALVRASYVEPVNTYATNVLGTVHVLEAVRRSPSVRVVVNVTSDKCYENREWMWGYRENDVIGGRDPYSSSKACAELVTAAYRSSFFRDAAGAPAVAVARAGNVIGGGDWGEHRLIPDMIRAIDRNEPLAVRNPNAVRPWQHVLEPLSGYLLLAQRLWSDRPLFAEAWNFGPADDDVKPVRWVVERFSELWGAGACWRVDSAPNPHEAHTLRLDSSKARTLLGWRSRWSLDRALVMTVDWYRAYQRGQSMWSVVTDQIASYATSS